MASEYDDAVSTATVVLDDEVPWGPYRDDIIKTCKLLAHAILAMAKRLERPTTDEIASLSRNLRKAHRLSTTLTTMPYRPLLLEAADLLESLSRRVSELEAERATLETDVRADRVTYEQGIDTACDALEEAQEDIETIHARYVGLLGLSGRVPLEEEDAERSAREAMSRIDSALERVRKHVGAAVKEAGK